MRNKFDQQLEQLHVELIKMGALCEEAISAASKALLDGDQSMAQTAIAREQDIDQKERDIESLCMKLLLQQQPVARDLRTISSALKMISDMERIGDQAADIAEITRHTSGASLPGQIHISEMTRAAVKMVTDSVDSFVKRDLHMAQGVIQYDDVVDQMFCAVKDELIGDDPPVRRQRRAGRGPADGGEVPGAHRGPRRQHRRVGHLLHHRDPKDRKLILSHRKGRRGASPGPRRTSL